MQMQDFIEITHTHADTECLSSMQASAIHTIYWIAQEGAHCFARGGRAPSCPWLAIRAWYPGPSKRVSSSLARERLQIDTDLLLRRLDRRAARAPWD